MKSTIILSSIAFGMFLLGVYWGYLFGQLSKQDEIEELVDEIERLTVDKEK